MAKVSSIISAACINYTEHCMYKLCGILSSDFCYHPYMYISFQKNFVMYMRAAHRLNRIHSLSPCWYLFTMRLSLNTSFHIHVHVCSTDVYSTWRIIESSTPPLSSSYTCMCTIAEHVPVHVHVQY